MKILKFTKWLLLATAIIVIILGTSMLFTPMKTIVGLAFFLGIVMLLSGLSEIFSYFFSGKFYRSAWVLGSGFISLMFGFWMLFGKGLEAVSVMLPFVFAGWVISGGVVRTVGSFSLKSAGVRFWWWLLVMGIFNVLIGLLLMYSPWLSAFMISYLIAFAFISHGINNLACLFSIHRFTKAINAASDE